MGRHPMVPREHLPTKLDKIKTFHVEVFLGPVIRPGLCPS